MAWIKELEVAARAARNAAEVALRMQPGITSESKSDHSPVTPADRECERLIAGILSEAFPDDGILGEEGARAVSRSGRRWIIDPIDGTRDYLRGNALWANLIALEVADEVMVGVVNLPMLGSLYKASREGGAYRNDSRMHVSSKKTVEESVLCYSQFNRPERVPFKAQLPDWMARFWAVRDLGGAPDAMMVAAGQAEIWIVEEAGARFLNFDGGSSIHAGNAVVFTPGLEGEVKRLLGLGT